MEPEGSPILIRVAEAVADGAQVDWDGLIAARPEVADELRLLRLYQRILTAHREAVGPVGGSEPPTGSAD